MDTMNTETTQAQAGDDEFCPPGECDMRVTDDSFDHQFGVHRVPLYLQCNVCWRTESMPEREP